MPYIRNKPPEARYYIKGLNSMGNPNSKLPVYGAGSAFTLHFDHKKTYQTERAALKDLRNLKKIPYVRALTICVEED